MSFVPILSKMETTGIPFDFESLDQHKNIIETRMNELSIAAAVIADREVNLGSPKQVGEVIYDSLKLLTDDGKKSTNEKILKNLDHPFVDILLEHRSLKKYYTNWIVKDSLHKYASTLDGDIIPRIRTHWRHTNTATGRLASRSPNLQCFPKNELVLKKGSISVNVRDSLCSSEGNVLVAADYSQMEMRVLAHMSGDMALINFFKDENDIFYMIASRCTKKKIEDISKKERDTYKSVVYGIIYGMGPKTLSGRLKVSVEKAQGFIKSFLGGFPNVDNFIQSTVNSAKRTGEVRTLYGRRRLLNFNDEHRASRQAVNTVIQGTAADIIKLSMIRLDRAITQNIKECGEARLLLQIHDELVFSVPDKKLYNFIKIINHGMVETVGLCVPTTITIELGKSWGSMIAYDDDIVTSTIEALSPAHHTTIEVEDNLKYSIKDLFDIERPDTVEDTGMEVTGNNHIEDEDKMELRDSHETQGKEDSLSTQEIVGDDTGKILTNDLNNVYMELMGDLSDEPFGIDHEDPLSIFRD
eukprot:TRINITY_DN12231_c0_g1_i1.p1 TRINITY_DN12231_c0_g1~~TRINITY_DN12231_c0_g1_i1.p1  ORF type:complete len:585 (-),score=113.90 TRINITY_DN12231_c0_g1_i1:15-1595(-)